MSTTPKSNREFPWIEPPPRNGTYTTHWDSGTVRVTGEYVDGLKQGSWKEYWPSGQLKQDYAWDRGLKHGHELDWSEEGVPLCRGQNARHQRQGTWTWWYADGTHNQTSSYDDEGKQHGDYLWDQPDHSPRACGEWWHGARHGSWEWRGEPKHERVIRGYHKGYQHGEDAAWYPGGQLAHRRTWQYGVLHGDEVHLHEDGSPSSKATWVRGVPMGESHSWDVDGNLTVKAWDRGLEQGALTDADIARVVKRLEKAKDRYAKEAALDKTVEWSERAALVYRLWKDGQYDVSRDPELWDTLSAPVFGLLSGEDVIELLRTATNDGWGDHLPYWARAMDAIVMDVYARDPEPIDAAWETLPDLNRKGVAFVLARFGKDVGDVLADEMGALVKKHVEQYALGDSILWPSADGRVEQRRLFDARDGAPTPLFDEFIALFGTREQWAQALEPHAMKEAGGNIGNLTFRPYRDVIEAATVEEMTTLCSGVSLSGETHRAIHDALWEWRGDDGEAMARIALGIDDDGLRKWPAVCAAILKLHAEGKAIDAALVDSFGFCTDSPTYTSEWSQINDVPAEFRSDPHHIAAALDLGVGVNVPRARRIHEALAVLSDEQVRSIFERHTASSHRQMQPAPHLYRLADPDMWAAFIALAEQEADGPGPRVAWGIGDIGMPVVPLLEAALERATTQKVRRAWSQALVVALTRAIVDGEEIPQRCDRHIRFDVVEDAYEYQFFRPYLARLIHLLPQERAETILLAGLESEHYWRALRLIGSHPTRPVLEKAFTRLLELESTMDYQQGQGLTAALAALPNPSDWVAWVLQSGGGAGCRDALREAVGDEAFDAIEKAAAAEGVEPVKPLDAIDRLVELAANAGNTGETLHLLRRLDAQANADLNVIGGAAPGVAAERWPMRDDEPMDHLFTLDLATMPQLAARYDARAISVFCFQADYNEAWEPDNDWTAVVFSTEAQIEAGGAPPDAIDPAPQAFFEVVTIAVDLANEELRSKVYQAHARVLGEPIWLQSDEYWGDFIMQFDEGFAHMNLGDMGVMYVFGGTAFWQCH